MQNIQVICEKILQGPMSQVMNPLVQMDTSFMNLLETLTQNIESEELSLINTQTSDGNEEKIEVNEEAILQTLSHFWINNSLNTNFEEVQLPKNTLSNVISTETQNHLVKSELTLENTEIKANVQFELMDEVVSLSSEKFVIETVDKNEIQKHFKILNQTKLKEVVKNEEVLPINHSIKQSHEVQKNNEIELTDLQMIEFKQSIDEMKGIIEQLSKKDDQTMIFKLKPEGLAEIVIKFEQKLGKVVLDISTSNRMVEQMIQKELPHLRDSLKSYQMEVNLNEMSYKNQPDQSRQPKYYQERQVYELVEDENVPEEWVFVPHSYGFNTYV